MFSVDKTQYFTAENVIEFVKLNLIQIVKIASSRGGGSTSVKR